jgi:hypothetical protein
VLIYLLNQLWKFIKFPLKPALLFLFVFFSLASFLSYKAYKSHTQELNLTKNINSLEKEENDSFLRNKSLNPLSFYNSNKKNSRTRETEILIKENQKKINHLKFYFWINIICSFFIFTLFLIQLKAYLKKLMKPINLDFNL